MVNRNIIKKIETAMLEPMPRCDSDKNGCIMKTFIKEIGRPTTLEYLNSRCYTLCRYYLIELGVKFPDKYLFNTSSGEWGCSLCSHASTLFKVDRAKLLEQLKREIRTFKKLEVE